MGYALDGFGIFGPRSLGGKLVTNADLDECHGHSHVRALQGQGGCGAGPIHRRGEGGLARRGAPAWGA